MVTTSLRLLVFGAVEIRLAKHPTADFSLADILSEISVDIGSQHPSGIDGAVREILRHPAFRYLARKDGAPLTQVPPAA